MLGMFQRSHLRLELEASTPTIASCFLESDRLRQWLLPQQLPSDLPKQLQVGLTFTTRLGVVTIAHSVEVAESNCLRLLLSEGIDGFHEWYWGDGWVQSRLEGISLLPLNLGQTLSLSRLREFVKTVDG